MISVNKSRSLPWVSSSGMMLRKWPQCVSADRGACYGDNREDSHFNIVLYCLVRVSVNQSCCNLPVSTAEAQPVSLCTGHPSASYQVNISLGEECLQ